MHPVRQCIACRKKRPKPALFRIVRSRDNKLLADPEQKAEGRGYYICPDKVCMARAIDSQLALMTGVRATSELSKAFTAYFPDCRWQGVESLLGFAVRARNCGLGWGAVESASKAGKVALILVDQLRGRASSSNAIGLAQRLRIPVLYYQSDRSLDEVVGKPNCRVAGITEIQFARSLQKRAKEVEEETAGR